MFVLNNPQAISRGITKAGVAVDMLNLETESIEDVSRAISSGDGFIIGRLLLCVKPFGILRLAAVRMNGTQIWELERPSALFVPLSMALKIFTSHAQAPPRWEVTCQLRCRWPWAQSSGRGRPSSSLAECLAALDGRAKR